MENTGLDDENRDTLLDWFRTFGRDDNSVYPHRRMQTRVRLDREAVIFECVVNTDWLAVDFLTDHFADVFGVNPNNITVVVSSNKYGTLGDFQLPAGTSRLRIGVFGGIHATWEVSRLACVAYLSAFSEAWEGEP
jgi:hypothetical protein